MAFEQAQERPNLMFLKSSLNYAGQVQRLGTGNAAAFIGGQGYLYGNPLMSFDDPTVTDSLINGFSYNAGYLRIIEGTSDYRSCGIAVTASGQMCVVVSDVDPEDAFYMDGVAVNGLGQVYVSA